MPTRLLPIPLRGVLILGAAFIALSPTLLRAQSFEPIPPLYFTKPFNGADPLPQTLSIAGRGGALTFTAFTSTSSGGNWLSVTGGSCGNNCATTPHVLFANVAADPVLAVGTYTGQIVVTAADGSTALTIPVTLNIAAQGSVFFDNLPGATSFFSKLGSANDPPAQSLQVRSGGAGSLSWTVTTSTADGGNWLTVSAASGTAPSWVAISVSKAALPSGGLVGGTFVGQLLFQTAGSSVTVPVSFVLGDNVFNQLNPIIFTKPFKGLDSLPQTLALPATGTGFNFSAFASTGTGGNWLSVTGGGSIKSGESAPQIMTAIIASPPLAAPSYTAQILFLSSDGAQAMTVPVYLTAVPRDNSFEDNLLEQLSFTSPFDTSTNASTPHALASDVKAIPAVLARSNFDDPSDATDGWTVMGDVASGPTRIATGGDPAGYIQMVDAAKGNANYWIAPAKFLGDQSGAYGSALTFDLIQNATDSQFIDSDVVLVGAGLTLVFDTAYNPGTTWTNYSVSLVASAGWKLDNISGAAVTEAQMRRVLGDLTRLAIRAEYRTGSDTDGLDNVVLNGHICCSFHRCHKCR